MCSCDVHFVGGGGNVREKLGNKLALELGYDAGFGRGTYPENVASFIAEKLHERGVK